MLASAGSAFWNSILEYLLKIRDLKKVEAEKTRAIRDAETARARVLNIEADQSKDELDLSRQRRSKTE